MANTGGTSREAGESRAMEVIAGHAVHYFTHYFNATLDATVATLVEISSVPIEQRRVLLLMWLLRICAGAWLVCGLWAVGERWRSLRRRKAGVHIVLYDGTCVMCNAFVDFCVAHDPEGLISVAPLESAAAITLMRQFGIPQPPSSFVLVEGDDAAYTRSDASLRTLSLLRPRAWLLMMLFEPVPSLLRDAVYDLGWRSRRALFGTCACRTLPGRTIDERHAAVRGICSKKHG